MKLTKTLFLCCCSLLFSFFMQAQNVTVKGVTTDENGLVLPGVSVSAEGTSGGTISDNDGNYKLEVPSNATLVFSYLGYTTLREAVNGRNQINVKLNPDVQELKEVVIIGFGSQNKKDITSSISNVKVDDISSRPIINAVEAISGKSAGVQVSTPSGAPGGQLSVRVRGVGSPNGGEPLYVVDGVIAANLTAIDPNNIESINILKDASAAGIYGAAGATNGVVIVTTKRGTVGKPLTEISFYTSVQKVTKKLGVLNNEQYLDLQEEIGGTPLTLPAYYDTQNTNNKWQDLIFRDAMQKGVNFSTSNGTKSSKYYLGLGYLDQDGVVDASEFKRYSAKLSIEQNTTDYLKIGGTVNYNRTTQRNILDNASANFGGVITSALVTPEYIPIFFGPGSPNPGVYGVSNLYSGENPVSAIFNNTDITITNNLLGNAFAEVSLPYSIKFKSQLNTTINNLRNDYFEDPFASLSAIPRGGRARSGINEIFRWGVDNTLSWKKSYQDHSFDAIVGTSALKETIFTSLQSGEGFSSSVVPTLNAASTNYRINSANYEWSTSSYFGRLNYSYKNRYLATATIRRDGSSRVGQNERWGNFPAFSAGWKVSNEKFMENQKVVQDLKVRVGWGKTGNLPPFTLLYPSYSLLNAGAPYSFNGGTASSGANPSNQLGNPNLKWESAVQTNIGFEAGFLNNNLTLTADYYHKKVEDLIFTQQLPLTTGGAFTALNLPGFNINKGFELALDAKIINKENFSWSSNFNISFNKNNIEGIDENISFQTGGVTVGGSLVPQFTQIIKNNYSLGTFWGYKSYGVDPQTGNLIYGDSPEVIGNALPDYTFGFSNDFRYKNFNLFVLIDASQGNDVYNALRMETESMVGFQNQSDAVLDRWQQPGDITDIPRALGNRGSNSAEAALLQNRISSHYIEDGSFIRMRNVTLAYNFEPKLIKKLGLSGAKVYLTGQNLFILTNYSGFNPEVNGYGQGTNNQAANSGSGVSLLSLGIDRGTYPASRIYSVGFNFQL